MSIPSSHLNSPLAAAIPAAGQPLILAAAASASAAQAEEAGGSSALNLLVIAASSSDARSIEPILTANETSDTNPGESSDGKDQAAVNLPVPLLTFASSLAGAQFCLDDSDSDSHPPFNALLWVVDLAEVSLPDAVPPIVDAAKAASLPLIAVSKDEASPTIQQQCRDLGLGTLIAIDDISVARLQEELDSTQQVAVAPNYLTPSEHLAILRKMARGIAHDVRNPLSCVQMGLDLMRAKFAGSQSVDMESIDTVVDAVQRAEQVIASVADFAQSAVDRRDEDLCACAQRAITQCQEHADERDVKLTLDCLVDTLTVHIQPSRMKLVFVELITNAINACSAGGEVLIRLGAYNGQARAVVIDNGPGLPDTDDRSGRIWFQPYFSQKIDLDLHQETGTGKGIGLARVANAIDLHEGRVALVNRTDGNGAVADLRLPLPDSA